LKMIRTFIPRSTGVAKVSSTTNKKGLQPTMTVDRRPFLLCFLVGAKGFEPSTPRSRTDAQFTELFGKSPTLGQA
jgi:hypothetical protein